MVASGGQEENEEQWYNMYGTCNTDLYRCETKQWKLIKQASKRKV